MRNELQAQQPEPIDFEYIGPPPSQDMLSYKNMMLAESRWAATGTGWMSVIAVFGLAVLCFTLVTFLWMVG
jgi:hypothetical protein